MLTVSVVIVSWNARQDLQRCLESLQIHTVSAQLELIVVDNASSDGSAAMVRSEFPQADLILNEANLGFARACNQGMARATGDFILLLNSDAYVEGDVVGRCATELADRPEYGMIGCELRYPDGRRQHTANRALGIRQSLLRLFWIYKLLPRHKRSRALLGGYWNGGDDIECDWLAGAFMLLRRELFEYSGGFDPRFFMYGEDSEWCMRLQKMGYRILYAPRLGVVYHRGAASSDLAWTERERLRRCYEGGLGAYEALHGRRRALLFRLVELLGCATRFAVYSAAAERRGTAYYQQQADFYGWLVMLYLGRG